MRKLKTHELHRPSVEQLKERARLPVVVVLDHVRSAYNVGSVFRTGDAFAVEKIYCCGITAAPPNREVMKTALGSTDSVPWEYVKEISEVLNELKSQGWKLVAVEQTDQSISLSEFSPDFNGKYALIFGNEVDGVSARVLPMADCAIEIPQFGAKHSLNISIAAGIVLWDFYNKWKTAVH